MDFRIKRSGHIVIRVADVAKSRRFFEDVVGLTIVGRDPNPRNMYFLTSDFKSNHHMVLIRPAQDGAPMPDPGRQIGMTAASFEVPSMNDLLALFGRLKDDGARIDRTEDRGGCKAVFVHDPDGNLFEFYCRTPESSGNIADYHTVLGTIDADLQPEPAMEGAQ